jgi:integrase/recombinase XerD
MGRKGDKRPRKPIGDASDPQGFQNLIETHLEDLRGKNYSKHTVTTREHYLRKFALWCLDRDLHRPNEITKPILERYQRWLYQYRNEAGKPLSFAMQSYHIMQVRSFFRWLCKKNYLLLNPASELEIPKKSQRLPQAVLSAEEADLVLAQANISEPTGLRDRAIMEVFYSTGIRRTELTELTIYSIDAERRTLMVHQGKGKKDRLLPIGQRALDWIAKYCEEGRSRLVVDPNEKTLFLSSLGLPLEADTLSTYISQYVKHSGVNKPGSCHLFRHTMATLMLDNGADIRYIQAMLGHSKLETTEVYTRVSITKLQQVHERTHPANEAPGFRDQASGQATDSPGEPKSEIPKESLGESEPS